VRIKNEAIAFAGIRFWTRQPGAIARVVGASSEPVILLAHDPRRLVQAAALAVPAVLSGHTHGGQVVLPGIGPVAGRRRFPVIAGLGTAGDTSIFVSRGVGTVFLPIRIHCPPEVAMITLAPGSRDRDASESDDPCERS
jgi:predicted MPP superfamily phosphohydrolase